VVRRPLPTVDRPTHPQAGPARRYGPIAALIILLATLVPAATAGADRIRVAHIHYLAASGATAATVRVTAPSNTAVAIALYRDRCPRHPAESEFVPGVSTGGQPHLLLANPPAAGASGMFELCIWTLHDQGAVGSRYSHRTTLPPPPKPSWSPVSGTDHPWWWPLVGWPTLLVFTILAAIAILLPVAMLRSVIRRFRNRHHEAPTDGSRAPTLQELQRAAADEAARGAASADAVTTELRVAPPDRVAATPHTTAAREQSHRAPENTDAPDTRQEHPFAPPAAPGAHGEDADPGGGATRGGGEHPSAPEDPQ
jgi:hypothetical protein